MRPGKIDKSKPKIDRSKYQEVLSKPIHGGNNFIGDPGTFNSDVLGVNGFKIVSGSEKTGDLIAQKGNDYYLFNKQGSQQGLVHIGNPFAPAPQPQPQAQIQAQKEPIIDPMKVSGYNGILQSLADGGTVIFDEGKNNDGVLGAVGPVAANAILPGSGALINPLLAAKQDWQQKALEIDPATGEYKDQKKADRYGLANGILNASPAGALGVVLDKDKSLGEKALAVGTMGLSNAFTWKKDQQETENKNMAIAQEYNKSKQMEQNNLDRDSSTNTANLQRGFADGGVVKKIQNPKNAKTDISFQEWYNRNTLEGKQGIPYSENLNYDYYSYFKNGERNGNIENHFPDTYKRPSHETFSNESLYSTPENPGGSWNGETFIPYKPKLNKNFSDGGEIKGKGTAKSDSIKAKVRPGSYVVPAENKAAAKAIKKQILGESPNKTAEVNQPGGKSVNLSDGEVLFTPEEVAEISSHGINLDDLAPESKSKLRDHLNCGGMVKNYAKGGSVTAEASSADEKFESVRKEAESKLKEKYPGKDVKVVYKGETRSFADQADNLKKGQTTSKISLHQVGGARDFNIIIDGRVVGNSGEDFNLYKDYVWKAAVNNGLYHLKEGEFGSVDPYHIGLVEEKGDGTAFKRLIETYPTLAETSTYKKTLAEAKKLKQSNPKDTTYDPIIESEKVIKPKAQTQSFSDNLKEAVANNKPVTTPNVPTDGNTFDRGKVTVEGGSVGDGDIDKLLKELAEVKKQNDERAAKEKAKIDAETKLSEAEKKKKHEQWLRSDQNKHLIEKERELESAVKEYKDHVQYAGTTKSIYNARGGDEKAARLYDKASKLANEYKSSTPKPASNGVKAPSIPSEFTNNLREAAGQPSQREVLNKPLVDPRSVPSASDLQQIKAKETPAVKTNPASTSALTSQLSTFQPRIAQDDPNIQPPPAQVAARTDASAGAEPVVTNSETSPAGDNLSTGTNTAATGLLSGLNLANIATMALPAYQIYQGNKFLNEVGDRPVDKIDPEFESAIKATKDNLQTARADAQFGFTPQEKELLRTRNVNALEDAKSAARLYSGGSAASAFGLSRLGVNDYVNRNLEQSVANNQVKMDKKRYADNLQGQVNDMARVKTGLSRNLFLDNLNAFNQDQQAGGALLNAGYSNAIGSSRLLSELNYSKERDAKYGR